MTTRQFGIAMMVFSFSMLAIGIARSGQAGAAIPARAERTVTTVVVPEPATQPAKSIRVILPSPYEAR